MHSGRLAFMVLLNVVDDDCAEVRVGHVPVKVHLGEGGARVVGLAAVVVESATKLPGLENRALHIGSEIAFHMNIIALSVGGELDFGIPLPRIRVELTQPSCLLIKFPEFRQELGTKRR